MCFYCEDGVYHDVLGSPCKYNFCPMCGQPLIDPKPLTLAELQDRINTPVWRVGVNVKEWIFPHSIGNTPYAQIWFFNSQGRAYTTLYEHEKYYDHPPKEAE